jgi:D-alanyl-lipoteichoic acid acyltransferase DltB (MBOAT superfamily)
MQFDSLTFLLFFALTLAVYNALASWNARKWLLLGASYLFYSAWNPPFLLLLLASTTLDWWIAGRIHTATTAAARKRRVIATLLINLGVLGYFKYSRFVLDNAIALLAHAGIVYSPPAFDIVLPIGISFYTFHSLSYCLDIYRGKFTPTRSWRDYALYVGFFPQLVAGPITRFSQMREQIETPRRSTAHGLGLGSALLVLGLFEKIVLADSLFAPVADAVFDAAAPLDSAVSWTGVLAFSGQIFCDFAGYSSCALGSALALGFVLPVNFRNPYAAIGFSDFWRRWHISLSTWLRDYVYASLGGNRQGAWHTYRNLMLTMLIGGLWHGAAWTFLVWGGLHGLLLSAERALREPVSRWRWNTRWTRAAYGIVTLVLVCLAWVWFRAHDVAAAWRITTRLFDVASLPAALASLTIDQRIAAGAFGLVVVVQWLFRERGPIALFERLPAPLLGLLLGVLLSMIVLSPGTNHAFIYFQF